MQILSLLRKMPQAMSHLGVILLFLSAPLFAWELLSPELQGWENRHILISIDDKNCDSERQKITLALKKVLEEWRNVLSGVRLEFSQTSSQAQLKLFCDRDFETYNMAVTRLVENAGVIQRADIHLCFDERTSSHLVGAPADVIEYVLRHELGHALGLGHSQEATSVMFSHYYTGKNNRLSEDEKKAMDFLYPREGHSFVGGKKEKEQIISIFVILAFVLFSRKKGKSYI
jgi:hypothetical protein